MNGHMTLLGAEEVSRAASRMHDAAEQMQRAAMNIDGSVDRLVRALEDHAARVEAAVAKGAA